MISKRIGIAPKNDNYGHLAVYIADAGHEGEKAMISWCAGCLGGDDYSEGVAEVRDTQTLNTRCKTAKTYHLVVSFRPEDEAKLTPEAFKAMEERFAKALGWSDHQRHCGVHKNTANLHMHIAYNMIHPEKYTLHKEFRDFWIRDKVCRELEREYGLEIDNGRERAAPDRRPLGEKAATVEGHTGQQSFESYAKEHRQAVLRSLEAATSWQDLHAALAMCGMEIKPHGNGLVVKDRHSQRPAHSIKASTLDRSLSQKKLEVRLGAYHLPQSLKHVQEHSRYGAAPLHRSPERGELYTEYRIGIETRKTRLETVKEHEVTVLDAIRAEWATKRRELEKMSIAKRNRRNLLQLARKHEAEALAKARLALQPDRETVRRDVPYTSWNGFLQRKAEQGSEVALAILRSTAETIQVEREIPATPEKDWSRHGLPQSGVTQAEAKAEHAARERAVLEADGLSSKGKTRLLAVLRMEQLAEEECRKGHVEGSAPLAISGFRHTVDHKGTVIFTLPGGGKIMDAGRELFFSIQNDTAKTAALGYARKKWGKAVRLDGNRIMREQEKEKAQEQIQEHMRKQYRDRER